MRVAIRTDASVVIGTGHVMRCLTLADELLECDAEVVFLCRELPDRLCELIESKGCSVYRLSISNDSRTDAQEVLAIINADPLSLWDYMVVDHYALDAAWEHQVRKAVKRLIVIDDLADRPHDCDILLDQNYYMDMNKRYTTLVPADCKLFLGPSYALLRREFTKARSGLRLRNGQIDRILVFYGGSDPTGETNKALRAIKKVGRRDIATDVVVGQTNPQRETIRLQCETMHNVQYYCQVDHMADLMARADLALGAGGSTAWERCSMGLPSITTIVAANQEVATIALAELGATWNLGWHQQASIALLTENIHRALEHPEVLCEMSKCASSLMDRRVSENWHPLVMAMMEARI